MIINNAKQVSLFKTDLTFTVVYYALKWPETYIVALPSLIINSPFTILTTVAHSQLNLINGYIIDICRSSSNLVQAVILFE